MNWFGLSVQLLGMPPEHAVALGVPVQFTLAGVPMLTQDVPSAGIGVARQVGHGTGLVVKSGLPLASSRTLKSLDALRHLEQNRNMISAHVLQPLRERIRLLERPAARHAGVLAFGVQEIDAHLPARGLPLAAVHEIGGGGDACATLFAAGILARLPRPVLWCARKTDVFAPGLAGVGLLPHRVLYADAPDDKAVFLVMEEALRHPGLSAVLGEVLKMPMLASRRLALAAEKSGVMGVALCRGQGSAAPNAACTRWSIAPHPSVQLPSAPLPVPGLGRARWQVDLTRCRGGAAKTWILEACDAQGCLAVPADMGHRQGALADRRIA